MQRLRRIRSEELAVLFVLSVLVLGAYGVSQYASADALDAGDSSELVAHYRFDEGAGMTVYDYSNNSNDGTISNGANWTGGRQGHGLKFDGSSADVVTDSVNIVGGSDAMTVSAWVYTETLPADYPGIVNQWNTTHEAWNLGLYPDDLKLTVRGDSGSATSVETGTTFPTGRWVHVAGVFHEEATFEKKLYVDGELVAESGTSTVSAINNTAIPVEFGQREERDAWNGTIDDVRIYNAALNQSQIKTLYNHGASIRTGTEPSSPEGKVLDIGFDKINDTHVFDTSGKTNHGKPQNGATQKGAVHCKIGRCYEFDGGANDEYVEIADSPELNITDNLTVMAWFKTDADNDGSFLASREGSDTDYVYGLYEPAGDSIQWYVRDSSGVVQTVGSGVSVEDGTWHHATGTFNGTHQKIYVDGVYRNQETFTEHKDIQHAQGTQIANFIGTWFDYGGSTQTFNGSIDQVKIFDKALSRQEIIEEAGLERDGAVLDLRFDEGTGATANDMSVHGNDGSLQPNESRGPDWVEGVSGGAVEMNGFGDGVSDRVQVSDSDSLSGLDQLTLSVWVNVRTPSQDTWFMRKNEEYTLRIDNNDVYYDVNATDWGWKQAGTTINADQWHHLVLTYNGAEQRLYVDGELADTTSETGGVAGTTNSFYLSGAGSKTFNGSIDNAKIYPYAISEEKIKELYKRGSSRIGGDTDSSRPPQAPNQSNLVLHHAFDDVNATHSLDSSGQMNHGTWVEGTPVEEGAAQCQTGRCLRFKGDEAVNVSDDPSISGLEEITVAGWMKTRGNKQDEQWFLRKHNEYTFRVQDTDNSLDYDVNAVDWNWRDSGFTVENDTWYHTALTFNGTHIQVYVDGEHVDTAAESGTISDETTTFDIVEPSDCCELHGSIDDVRIYNTSLSNEEIWHLYSTGRDQSGSTAMAGPAGWWRLDNETGQTAYDYSGEGNDGTLGNSSSFTDPTWVSGCQVNGCLDFDGDDDYVDVPGQDFSSVGFSVVTWTYPRKNGVTQGVYSNDDVGGILRAHDTRNDGSRFGFNGGSWHELAGSKLSTDTWQHLAGVYNGSHLNLYIDGRLDNSTTASGDPQSASTGFIGQKRNDNDFFDGRLDDVRIYPYALTQEQVQQVMKAGSARIG